MNIHANGIDGKVHIHGCPEHPGGSLVGGSACFWDDDHGAAFRAVHRGRAISGLTKQIQDENHPVHKDRLIKSLSKI